LETPLETPPTSAPVPTTATPATPSLIIGLHRYVWLLTVLAVAVIVILALYRIRSRLVALPKPQTVEAFKHCLECGAKLKVEAKFCDECGAKQE
jgi:hypothetical protein